MAFTGKTLRSRFGFQRWQQALQCYYHTGAMVQPSSPPELDGPSSVSGHEVWKLCKAGRLQEALQLLTLMQHRDLPINSNTYACVLEHCTKMRRFEDGKRVHQQLEDANVELDIYLGNSLVTFYSKSGDVASAEHVFQRMTKRDVVSWSSMIAGYVSNHYPSKAFDLFEVMNKPDGPKPNRITFLCILKACRSSEMLETGKAIHGHVKEAGLDSDVVVATALLTMYSKCGDAFLARQVFDTMRERNVVSWTSIIQAYTQHGQFDTAFELYQQMLQSGISPNVVTFISTLNSCVTLNRGREVHSRIKESGFETNMVLANALITMYCKCGSVEDARQVFDGMAQRDVVSYSALIAGYAQSGRQESVHQAVDLLRRMQREHVLPNKITFMSVLKACSLHGALDQGRQIHGEISKLGFTSDNYLQTAVFNMYASCGSILEAEDTFRNMALRNVVAWTSLLGMFVKLRILPSAERVFADMPTRNIVSWNHMIAGYAQNGEMAKAFALLSSMKAEGFQPDRVTMVSILEACGWALERGKLVHAEAVNLGLDLDPVVATSLIGMYSKCGELTEARKLFENLPSRDVVAWNAMISGHGHHGDGTQAVDLFKRMLQEDVRPNEITFTAVISACRHGGFLQQGWEAFRTMQEEFGLTPGKEHYGAMVDLLGRAGEMKQAEEFIQNMPCETDVSVWYSLLAACKLHNDVELAERAARRALELEPSNVSVYVTLSNVYAQAGRWEDASKVRNVMDDKGLKKERGESAIEVEGKMHSFGAEDQSHPEIEAIHGELEKLSQELKEAGYVPDMRFVLHDVDDVQKEKALCHHSEKLAIAYGLLKNAPGTPIRVMKNLRVCGDCHTATKLISKIRKREIVARDANRFHYFNNGACSCGDFW